MKRIRRRRRRRKRRTTTTAPASLNRSRHNKY